MTAQPITAAHPAWCSTLHRNDDDPCTGAWTSVDLSLMGQLDAEPDEEPCQEFLDLTVDATHHDDEGKPSIRIGFVDQTVAYLTADEAAKLAVELVSLVSTARSNR